MWNRLLLFVLACTSCPANSSLLGLRVRRGSRSQVHGAEQQPVFGVAASSAKAGLTAATPESIQNLAGYQVAAPTPLPAALNGVFCRGASCQYRVEKPAPTFPPAVTPPPLPLGVSHLSSREFCKGLSCIHGMGMPSDPNLATFNVNCAHLLNDIGGGLKGADSKRSVSEVFESFDGACKKRVGVLEAPSCPVYANTVVGAISAKVNSPTVGGAVEVCTDTYTWLQAFKQAEVDMKLIAAALPKGQALLSSSQQVGAVGVGVGSARGQKWEQYVQSHSKWPAPPTMQDGGASLLQESPAAATKQVIPGADSAENTPRGAPKYVQSPVASDGKAASQAATKYQIAPGSADGSIPPVEVAGDLYTYCTDEFSEIMLGFSQTASGTVQMTKDWCAWQSSVSSWIGKEQELGHPEWTHRTCSGMENLVAFSLRDHLSDTQTGLSPQQVCKEVFLAVHAVHRTESIIKDVWGTSNRDAPSSAVPSANDADMKELLNHAQDYANQVFSKLRGQKAAFEKLNTAKMNTAAFETQSASTVVQPEEPELPNVKDFKVALLSLHMEETRRSHKIGVASERHLHPWGSGD